MNRQEGRSDGSAALERLRTEHTETERVILERRSVRKYKKEQVPDWMIKRVLEAGRFAPSAGNGQPWRFVVVREQKIIDDVTADVVRLSKQMSGLLDYRRKGKGWLRPLAKLSTRLKPADLHPTPFGALTCIADGVLDLYHGAPTVIILLKDVRGIANPDLDCGIAGQNMVLAAHSLGLGTCWVSFAKLAFQYTTRWKKFFGVEYPYKFITSLAVGWPKWEPDGEVDRETHAVEWYEGGRKQVLDANLGAFDPGEKRYIPTYDDPREVRPGAVASDPEKCTGCTICTQICPAGALEVADKRMRMKARGECMFCGDCKAICPEGAVRMLTALSCKGYYKSLDRGAPALPRLTGEW